MNRIGIILMVLAVGFTAGCGSSGGGSAPPPLLITVSITPEAAQVKPGVQVQFTAKATGGTDERVQYYVVEGSGGSVSAGGRYTAPPKAGTYRVVAQSVADGRAKAEAVVTVLDYERRITRLDAELVHRRAGHSATLLADGSVVFFGGFGDPDGFYSPNAERFDPGTLSFTRTTKLDIGFAGHAAVALSNGVPLYAGGYAWGGPHGSAFVYEPVDGPVRSAGEMTRARMNHTMVALAGNKALVAGGVNYGPGYADVQASAEIYDAATAAFTLTGSMNKLRRNHTATVLRDGRVLIVGGSLLACDDFFSCPGASDIHASAEIYDPATGTFTLTGNLTFARYDHTATLLPDGRVLIAGGTHIGADGYLTRPPGYEIYDPATGRFTPAGAMHTARVYHTATVLGDGKVLIVGGLNDNDYPQADTELYDPVTGTTQPGPQLLFERAEHTATRLADGSVLIVGGHNLAQATGIVERFR